MENQRRAAVFVLAPLCMDNDDFVSPDSGSDWPPSNMARPRQGEQAFIHLRVPQARGSRSTLQRSRSLPGRMQLDVGCSAAIVFHRSADVAAPATAAAPAATTARVAERPRFCPDEPLCLEDAGMREAVFVAAHAGSLNQGKDVLHEFLRHSRL
mmetsp:Transcript_16659/g.32578  ORF Transcript_16659/g.32578 Transcript_16659/m.32578 type:complete len:154 (+) Transcript_16659:104-565(+)|eukprot:CAMPEP_0172894786 /NCGR_PEP_ID=MMETSP1075-20121228/151658_1 /TAXON_ID=2916 /ORGANISM="Ceratium fusus, Strain PA161109" /LENGTH=153 /DNA_ID=CAMNT_0013749865 /DNA_START=20 /DNA_END=481 /DNA_ORIENTATION=-